MKICPNCGQNLTDDTSFCVTCGYDMTTVAPAAPANPANAYQQYNPQPTPPYQTTADPRDFTAKFDPQDISDNKVIAMLPYLTGFMGIIIALLSVNHSEYVAFHLKQALKLLVCNVLLVIICTVLCFTFIVPFAAGVCLIILFVVKIMCFVDVCKGRAREPAIVCNLKFLK